MSMAKYYLTIKIKEPADHPTNSVWFQSHGSHLKYSLLFSQIIIICIFEILPANYGWLADYPRRTSEVDIHGVLKLNQIHIPKTKLETHLDPCILNQSEAVCMAFRNPTIQLQKQNRRDKWPFNNYVDLILPLFDHLPTST